MKQNLREEDTADIKVGDGFVDLLVNGEVVATEECDTSDDVEVDQAVDLLARRAAKLGYVEEAMSDDEEEEEEDGEEEEEEEEEEVEESATTVTEASTALASILDANRDADTIRHFDGLVAEGKTDVALEFAEHVVSRRGQLDEYRRMVGSQLSRMRRSRSVQTAAEKMRNRKRRMAYRTNSTMRRNAKVYRRRVKRFIRR